MSDTVPQHTGEADHPAHRLPPGERKRLQRSWYFYDWAVSAYTTTTMAVLLGPYLTAVATAAACPDLPSGERCLTPVSLLGLDVLPGALAPLSTTLATIIGALLLPIVGAIADRTEKPRHLLAVIAWMGAAAGAAMGLATDGNWALLVLCQTIAVFSVGASMTVYDSILVAIATPDERDRVSSRGWALGYLGGFLLLAVNLVMVSQYERFGLTMETSVRVSLASAGLWWAAFTIIPWWGLRKMPTSPLLREAHHGGLISGAFGQLWRTLRELIGYRNTWLFLLASLFFNDGLQTVIANAALYGQEELGLSTQQMMLTILVVQAVAFVGALLFGGIAARVGSRRAILLSLVIWGGVVGVGMVLPHGQFTPFLVLAVGIGLVLGGTQALARALFSQLVPYGKEAEYFAFYQAAERGTSWFGSILFSLMFTLTHSYRPALASLVLFFVIGGLLLAKVNVREGIQAAGNKVPNVI